MSAPWMPLYVADYLADTRQLSTIEHGAYMLLIMEYWRKGGLPDDDILLARITGMTEKEWQTSSKTLAMLFQKGWKHKRIDDELEKSAAKSIRRKEAGSIGGNVKALKYNGTRLANDTVLLHQNSSIALASSSQPQSQSDKEINSGGGLPSPVRAAAALLEVEGRQELARRLELATGWKCGTRQIEAIEKLIADGVSVEDRIIPMAKTVAAEFTRQDKPPPDTWAYLVKPIGDPDRLAAPAAKPVELVWIVENSPEWDELKTKKKESYLRSMLKTATDGTQGIYWHHNSAGIEASP